jgi:hypothetical protein
MSRIVIGLSGRKGVGKTYVSYCIHEYLKHIVPVESFAFADPIKDFATDILGLPENLCHGTNEDKMTETKYDWSKIPRHGEPSASQRHGKMTIREIFQTVGTELGRDTWGDDIWINCLKRKVEGFFARYSSALNVVVIVSDVRFENEVDAVRALGGEIWGISGPQRIGESSLGDTHSSEPTRNFDAEEIVGNDLDTSAQDIIDQVKLLFDNRLD